MSKSLFKRCLWIALVCGGVSACASSGQGMATDGSEPRSYTVLIVNHGWHTGLVLPAHELRVRLPQLAQRFPDTPYLELGWGDDAFYRAEAVNAGLALRALLWPTSSVMHVVAVPPGLNSYFPARPREQICVTRRQYLALVDFAVGSFLRDRPHEHVSHGGGELTTLEGGLYGNSQFYRAVGSYHLFNNCNTWLAKGLQIAGMPITPALMLTAQSLMDHLREQAEMRAQMQADASSACM